MKSLLVLFILLVVMQAQAGAHYPIVAQDIDDVLILHIEPGHYPVAGMTNKVVFFKSSTADIAPKDYDGTLTIASGDYKHTQELLIGTDALTAEVMFPSLSTYAISVELRHRTDSAKDIYFSGDVDAIPNTKSSNIRRHVSFASIGAGGILLGFTAVRKRKQAAGK